MVEGKRCVERMCAVCRKKGEKNSFIRIVKNKSGDIKIDNSYKENGRGLYLCKSGECINKAVKSKLLNRSFKSEIDSKIYEELSSYDKS